MKVIEKGVKCVYRFTCCACGSKLEAECKDLETIGNRASRYYCPICKKLRYISWSALRCKTIASE